MSSDRKSEFEARVESCASRQDRLALFDGFFGSDASPEIALKILERRLDPHKIDTWFVFGLVHEDFLDLIVRCVSVMQQIDDLTKNFTVTSWTPLNFWTRLHSGSGIYGWRRRFTYLPESHCDVYSTWSAKATRLDSLVETAINYLEDAHDHLVNHVEKSPIQARYLEDLSKLTDLMRQGRQGLQDSMAHRLERENEKIARVSGSSGASIHSDDQLVSGQPVGGNAVPSAEKWYRSGRLNRHSHSGSKTQHRARKLGLRDRVKDTRRRISLMLGRKGTVWTIVMLGFIASILLTAFAVLKAKQDVATDPVPVVDSNFFSTLSSTSTALLGIFTILIPLFQRDRRTQPEIPVAWPRVFKALLFLSLLTTLASSCVYPWQAIASIIIAFISSAAQIIATLLLIISASNKISQSADMIEGLEMRVRDLGG